MEWKDIGKSLLGLAPTLATALGGPAGMIAGGAIKVLTGFLGLPDDASAQQAQEALKNLSPEQWKELQLKDLEFNEHVLAAGVDLEKIAAGDRDSARKMYIDSSKLMTNLLALIIVLGWIFLNYAIFTTTKEFANKDLVLRTLGTLDMAVGGVIYFFFGSSRGSDVLKDILAKKH